MDELDRILLLAKDLGEKPPEPRLLDAHLAFGAGLQTVVRGLGGTLGLVGVPTGWVDEAVKTIPGKPPMAIEDALRAPGFINKAASVENMVIGWLANQIPIMGSTILSGAVAGPVGIAAASYILNAGNLYMDLKEKGAPSPRAAAAAAGIPMAMLDIVTPAKLLGHVKWIPTRFLRSKNLASWSLGEGTGELFQAVVEESTKYIEGVSDGFDAALSNFLNSFTAGAFVGGVAGAGERVAGRWIKPKPKTEPGAEAKPIPQPAEPSGPQQLELQFEPQAGPQQLEPQLEPQAAAEPQVEPEPRAVSEPQAVSEPLVEPEPKVEPEPLVEPEPQPASVPERRYSMTELSSKPKIGLVNQSIPLSWADAGVFNAAASGDPSGIIDLLPFASLDALNAASSSDNPEISIPARQVREYVLGSSKMSTDVKGDIARVKTSVGVLGAFAKKIVNRALAAAAGKRPWKDVFESREDMLRWWKGTMFAGPVEPLIIAERVVNALRSITKPRDVFPSIRGELATNKFLDQESGTLSVSISKDDYPVTGTISDLSSKTFIDVREEDVWEDLVRLASDFYEKPASDVTHDEVVRVARKLGYDGIATSYGERIFYYSHDPFPVSKENPWFIGSSLDNFFDYGDGLLAYVHAYTDTDTINEFVDKHHGVLGGYLDLVRDVIATVGSVLEGQFPRIFDRVKGAAILIAEPQGGKVLAGLYGILRSDLEAGFVSINPAVPMDPDELLETVLHEVYHAEAFHELDPKTGKDIGPFVPGFAKFLSSISPQTRLELATKIGEFLASNSEAMSSLQADAEALWKSRKRGARKKKRARAINAPPINEVLGRASIKSGDGPRIVFNRVLMQFLGIRQIQYLNPNFVPLADYVENISRGFFFEKTRVLRSGDEILRDWAKISLEKDQKLSAYLLDLMDRSYTEERRLNETELGELIAEHKLTPDLIELAARIDKFFTSVLNDFTNASIDELSRIFGEDDAGFEKAKAELMESISKMQNRNFFPATRFGRWATVVKALKTVVLDGKKYRAGQIIHFSTSETSKGRDEDFDIVSRDITSKLEEGSYEIYKDWISDAYESLLSFPPILLDMLGEHLNLSDKQKDLAREYMSKLSPGTGWTKHMVKKKNVRGASMDARRAFASYVQSSANHLARIKYRWILQNNVRAIGKAATGKDRTKVRQLQDLVARHFEAMMNPTVDFQAIRGAMWLMYFGLVPKQALINLTELPMFAFPHLIKRFGISIPKAAKFFAGALSDAIGRKPLDPDTADLLDTLTDENLIDQSFATEVSAAAETGMTGRYLARTKAGYNWRQFIHYSTVLFSIIEKYNRRVTAIAAYRIARSLGYSHVGAVNEAREASSISMGDYSVLNRPELMRGKKSLVFIFRMFLQKSLFYAATNQGGLGWYLLLAATAGLTGLPLAEDLLSIIEGAVTALRGKKTDLKVEAIEMFKRMSEDFGGSLGDFVMHGISRSSFGLTGLNSLFGVPIPAVDLSASMSLGKIVGVDPLVAAMEGTEDPDRAILEFASYITGVAPYSGISITKAALEQSPSSAKWIRAIPSMGMRNILKFTQAVTTNKLTNARGDKLIDFDFRNPEHVGEAVGMLLGAQPTRLTRKYEASKASMDFYRYHSSRREALLAEYALAVYNKDKEEIKDLQEEIKRFNARMASDKYLRPFAISAVELSQSIREVGLPTQRRFVEVHQRFLRAYGLQPTPSTPQSEAR